MPPSETLGPVLYFVSSAFVLTKLCKRLGTEENGVFSFPLVEVQGLFLPDCTFDNALNVFIERQVWTLCRPIWNMEQNFTRHESKSPWNPQTATAGMKLLIFFNIFSELKHEVPTFFLPLHKCRAESYISSCPQNGIKRFVLSFWLSLASGDSQLMGFLEAALIEFFANLSAAPFVPFCLTA